MQGPDQEQKNTVIVVNFGSPVDFLGDSGLSAEQMTREQFDNAMEDGTLSMLASHVPTPGKRYSLQRATRLVIAPTPQGMATTIITLGRDNYAPEVHGIVAYWYLADPHLASAYYRSLESQSERGPDILPAIPMPQGFPGMPPGFSPLGQPGPGFPRRRG